MIRRARPDEAADLSALALRATAHWGYNAAFMTACVPSLTYPPERLAAEPFFVIEDVGQVVGFCGLRIDGDGEAELTNLFVEPRVIGQGVGTRLWRHAIEVAGSLAVRRVRIESDPFAEAFYRSRGAERIGEVPSDAIPGRMTPLLIYSLPASG